MQGRDPIKSELAIDSFRSQGFSTTSAICEIIDNSIEASATEIHVKLKWQDKKSGQKYSRVKEFIFVDNGEGMNNDRLYDCLVLGESTRRLKSKGIGKFGVGATFSGISQGRRIEVFSKPRGGQWSYTYLDLDLLKQDQGIPEPITKEPPNEYQNEYGTIIIWSKIDRGDFTENNIHQLMNNLGRTYRKFLTKKKLEDGKIIDNEPIIISINGEKVIPYDPLFLTYNRKADETEKVESFQSNKYQLKKNDLKSSMRITITYLPESWWNTHGAGNKMENTQQRQIDSRNEGISVVREGREVLFGDIPYFKLNAIKKKFIEVDRWTSIEVSFNRDADDLIEVQNNKSRLLISSYVRDEIARAISAVIEERRKYIDRIRKKTSGNNNSNTSVNTKPSIETITEQIPVPNYNEQDQSILKKTADRLSHNAKENDQVYQNLLKGFHVDSNYDLDPIGPFVTYQHELKTLIVRYNMNHPFMNTFVTILNSIATLCKQDPNNALDIKENRDLRVLFDILMASFGMAKQKLGDTSEKQEIETTFNTLIANWGDISHSQVRKYNTDDS